MPGADDITIQRILRHYNDLPFRLFRQATPVQVMTAFHHLILKIHADLGFNFSTVNARTHQRFAKSMAALGLELYTPALTSVTRLDKYVLIEAFNALIDLVELRHTRLPPNRGDSPVTPDPCLSGLRSLAKPRSKRASTASSLHSATGLPKPRLKRTSIVATAFRPPPASPSFPCLPPTYSTPSHQASTNVLRSSVLTLRSLTTPTSRTRNLTTEKASTHFKLCERGATAARIKPSAPAVQHVAIMQVPPRAIKSRLSLLPTSTPSSIGSLHFPKKPRPSVIPVIAPAELPEGFEDIDNPFKTKAKLRSTPVASRVRSQRDNLVKDGVPLKVESDARAFETKPKIARTPDISSNPCERKPVSTNRSVDLSSLYNRFLITEDDDNLPLRTIRKLIKAQKAIDSNHDNVGGASGKESKNSSRVPAESCNKENRRDSNFHRRKHSTSKNESSAKNSPAAMISEKRPLCRFRNPIASIDRDCEDDLIREASALLQRCELSDDEQSRKRAIGNRKLVDAIITIRKSVAPRSRRK